MVIGYHLIFTAYGWWLPNDPRGSSSHVVRSDIVAELGELHHGRKHNQPNSAEIRAFYERARAALKHELRTFDAHTRTILACGFARVIEQRRYTCYGCAILPDHVHILIRKHRDKAEAMIANLQQTSRDHLLEQNIYPSDHPVWGGPGWKVFLDTADDIERTIRYIEKNPIPYKLPVQHYDFVEVYDGWDLSGSAR
jgi:REP element-mobilizing transposase RayT